MTAGARCRFSGASSACVAQWLTATPTPARYVGGRLPVSRGAERAMLPRAGDAVARDERLRAGAIPRPRAAPGAADHFMSAHDDLLASVKNDRLAHGSLRKPFQN